jgi:hypothetical protein
MLTELPPLPHTLRGFNCFNNVISKLAYIPYGLEIFFCGANPFMNHGLPTLPNTIQMYDFYNDLNIASYYSFSNVG